MNSSLINRDFSRLASSTQASPTGPSDILIKVSCIYVDWVMILLGLMRLTFIAVTFFIGVCSIVRADTPPEGAIWNAYKNTAAVSIPGAAGTRVTAYIRKDKDVFLEVDLSRVEDANFGKLGRHRNEYDKYETKPLKWMILNDGLFQVEIQTQAWRNGKRYTVYESPILRYDGTILWR